MLQCVSSSLLLFSFSFWFSFSFLLVEPFMQSKKSLVYMLNERFVTILSVFAANFISLDFLITSIHPSKMAVLKANDRAFGLFSEIDDNVVCFAIYTLWLMLRKHTIMHFSRWHCLSALVVLSRWPLFLAHSLLFTFSLLFSLFLCHLIGAFSLWCCLIFRSRSRSFYRYRHFLIFIFCLQCVRMLYRYSAHQIVIKF